MNLLLIGATGRTGRHVLAQGAQRGHKVLALVREQSETKDLLGATIATGDPRSVKDIKRLLTDQDAVVSCLGQKTSDDKFLLEQSSASLIDALNQSKISRCLVVSQGLLSASRSPLVALLRLILARHVTDSTAMERNIIASNLDWTIVRPPRLLDGGQQNGYSSALNSQPKTGSSMQRADLAAFILDAIEQQQFIKAIVGVGPGAKNR
jgi:putative NADH-flavin reductase